jgi:hypothetical protein
VTGRPPGPLFAAQNPRLPDRHVLREKLVSRRAELERIHCLHSLPNIPPTTDPGSRLRVALSSDRHVTSPRPFATLTCMKLAFDLSDAQSEALISRAKTLGVAPEDLARAAVADVLSSPSDDFRARAEQLLLKNAELYRRLA